MRFNKAIAAMLGISMTATPVLAQSAAPLSPVSAASRAGATTQNANSLDTDGYLLPALVILAILAAAILLIKSDGDPASP
jgi:hypothetical protein